MNPTRLEFEPMRDSWLAVAGNLDLKPGGRGFEIQDAGDKGRRAVYAFIDRQDLPQLFRTFDFASPDVSTAQRPQTTIPQQALFAMNSAFLVTQARALIRADVAKDPAERIRVLYHRVYARDPSAAELQAAEAYLNGPIGAEPADDVASAWQYGYGTLDPVAKKVQDFHPFPKFVNQHWGGATLPDANLGWVHLTANGGHPGQDAKHCAIRRWISPIAGEIEIRGTLNHPADQGDGIRGWIVSSRAGAIKEWTVKHGKRAASIAALSVQPGEKIDFVVDCRKSQDHDSFTWAPIIKTKQIAGSSTTLLRLWNSTQDFSGPPPSHLTPWEQLAQALLISNEFVFVD
jgi:hypothetical protein